MRTVLAHTVVSDLSPAEVVSELEEEILEARRSGMRLHSSERVLEGDGVDMQIQGSVESTPWEARVRAVPHRGRGSVITAEVLLPDTLPVAEAGRMEALRGLSRGMTQLLVAGRGALAATG